MTNSQRVLLNERISKLAHILARVPQGSYYLPGCLKSSSGATSNIFHPQAAKKCCDFSAANFICSPIYVELFIHVQQNAWITFEITLESSIIKDGLKVKTSSLYCSAFTRWRGRSSNEKKSKAKHLSENMAPKNSWTRNLQQSIPRINRSKIIQRSY